MQILKIVFRVVFGLLIFLFCIATVLNIFFHGVTFDDGLVIFYLELFLEFPIFLVFVLVILYCCLYKKTPISFFKTELIYLSIQIGMWFLLGFSQLIFCPKCLS